MVILKLLRHTTLAHLLELAAFLPGVRPRAIVQRIAYGVVGNRLPIVRCQLVLPVAIRVGTGNKKGMARGRVPSRGVGLYRRLFYAK